MLSVCREVYHVHLEVREWWVPWAWSQMTCLAAAGGEPAPRKEQLSLQLPSGKVPLAMHLFSVRVVYGRSRPMCGEQLLFLSLGPLRGQALGSSLVSVFLFSF